MIFAVKNGAIHQVSTTSSITSSVTSSVTPIQQNLPSTSTPTQPSSSESSNKTSRGQTYREKMKEMLENRWNKRIQRKLPTAQTSTNSEEEKFRKNLPETMERQDNLFWESIQNLQENVRALPQIMNQGVHRNPPPFHYQASNFRFAITSSFSCESKSQRNPNLGESSNIFERQASQINGSIMKIGEEKNILFILTWRLKSTLMQIWKSPYMFVFK